MHVTIPSTPTLPTAAHPLCLDVLQKALIASSAGGPASDQVYPVSTGSQEGDWKIAAHFRGVKYTPSESLSPLAAYVQALVETGYKKKK